MPDPVSGQTNPAARCTIEDLGRTSPTFRHALRILRSLYHQVNNEPQLQVRFQEWQSCLAAVYGEPVGDEELFVRHTYASILTRLIALRHIRPHSSPLADEDLVKVMNGDYFRERDIYNFGDEDFFTWVLDPKVLDQSLDLVRRLGNDLDDHDLLSTGHELLKGLYRELADPEGREEEGKSCAPGWLAERILSEELKLQDRPDLSVLDPACASGTFLSTAIRLIREGMLHRGEDEFDTLLHILNSVMGLDAHPVAVAIARTNYLLALGDLISGPHPPVLVPVYRANATLLPETAEEGPQGAYEESLHIVRTAEANVAFELPDSVVSDPAQLDWLVHRLGQYLHAASFRTRVEGEEHATEEVINSLYSYLTSPKRAGLRQLPPLSSFAAEAMCKMARSLIKLALDGKDTIWLDILKNALAPVFLSRRKFDLVVSDPMWVSTDLAAHFLTRCADLYLSDGGSIALGMKVAMMKEDQHSYLASFFSKDGDLVLHLESVLDLDETEPKSGVHFRVVVARKAAGTQ